MQRGRDSDQIGRILIRRLRKQAEAEACARLMANSEPWITLNRGYRFGLGLLKDKTREVYVALATDRARKSRKNDKRLGAPRAVGFVILNMLGPLKGYVQTIGVAPDWRNRGIGSRLMNFAEKRICRESENVFLCVSSFNTLAKRLYARRGYKQVGNLKDYVVKGHSELLMRKACR